MLVFHAKAAIIGIFCNLVSVWNLRFFRKLFHALASDLGLASKDVEYLITRSKREGLGIFTKILPKLGKDFDRSLSTGYLEISSGFKKLSRRKIPHFMGAFFLKVFYPSGVLRHDACPVAVRAIRQVCYAFYKVDLPYKHSDRVRVANSFVETDNSLRRERVSQLLHSPSVCTEWERRVLAIGSDLVQRLFGEFTRPARPHYSGGTVVEGYNQIEKFNAPKRSKKPWSLLGKFISPFYGRCTDLELYPVWKHHDYFSYRNTGYDCSEVLFVPKDSRGPRLICREPSDYMYVQKGMMDYMVGRLESHPLTRGQINFTDQTINQDKSRIGSIDKSLATLDLKDASDRNSLALVKLLWARCPAALMYLLASRTSYSNVEGRVLELAKFAPMGSALCFPVMATNIFALLCGVYVVEEFGTLEDACKSIYVYGDDIIVPTAFVDSAKFVLNWFGFKVNEDKSFVDSYFTESCGTDWFKGNHVTPTRVRSQCLPTNPAIVSWVMTARLFSQNGMNRAAECLYSFAESFLGHLPWGSDQASYLSRWSPKEDVGISNYFLPVGKRLLSAWTIVQKRQQTRETMYTRLERVLPLCGRNDAQVIPEAHMYSVPRRFTLRKRVVEIA